jgi:pseudouridine synthase
VERLQKVLARAGIASRRHAETLITAGRVRVNGVPVTVLGTRVDPERDSITVDGQLVCAATGQSYIALHKPRGYVTTRHDPQGRPTVMNLVPEVAGLIPVGRLDADSSGLLLLTTDGDWAQRHAHPRYGSTKEYVVDVSGAIDLRALMTLRAPMALAPDERTTDAEVDVLERHHEWTRLAIVLHEGRNRQIRRMLDLVGHPVLRLQRIRVGHIWLGDLPEGRWRHLSASEIRGRDGGTAAAVRLRRRPA